MIELLYRNSLIWVSEHGSHYIGSLILIPRYLHGPPHTNIYFGPSFDVVMGSYMSCNTGKSTKVTCGTSKDSDQLGHPPSLIRVFPVCLKGS